MSRFSIPLAVAITSMAFVQTVSAQDMTVYTTVTRVEEDSASSPVVGRSLTLFHAGKVYDIMEDIGEVVILEPIHDRFVILNWRSYVAARVEFSELHQLLKVARHESEQVLRELSVSEKRGDRRRAAALEFQLQPQFHESYEPTLNRLQLTSDSLSYRVETARIDDPQYVRQYLVYADWACRLNYVLHPHSLYPASREALNESLLEKTLVPTVVELRMKSDEEIVLRANHRFQWGLQPSDKSNITRSEKLLDSDQVEWVSFHEYQQRFFSESSSTD